jgi:hypothetical protein
MLKTEFLLTSASVLERTRAGQCETLTEDAALNPLERRLLAIVTGYTAIGDLLGLLGEADLPQTAIKKLMEAGLLRVASNTCKALDKTPPLWSSRRYAMAASGL